MKAVLLCAGKSTRTYPLTLTRPKPLLHVANTTILEHNLTQLLGLASEAVLIVGYKKEMIQQRIGKKYGTGKGSINIVYVDQQEQKGTGHALLQAKPFFKKGEILLALNGDDVFFRDDIKKLLKLRYAGLVKAHPHPEGRFGVFVLDKRKNIPTRFVEKSETFVSNLVNIGCYVLDASFFDFPFSPSPRGEIELTDFVQDLIEKRLFHVVEAKQWHPVIYPWDLLEANAALLSHLKKTEKKLRAKGCTIEKNVTIKNTVLIGRGTTIKSGTYIDGPVVIGENCVIGPNAYLRPSTVIGSNCKIGFEVEMKNSVVFNNSTIPHLSYIGDSVIGEGVNVAAGSITANVRHDAGLIRSSVQKNYGSEIRDELVDTNLHKLGTVLADGVKLGIRTLIYPGRKIWPGKTTLPGQIVTKDIKD